VFWNREKKTNFPSQRRTFYLPRTKRKGPRTFRRGDLNKEAVIGLVLECRRADVLSFGDGVREERQRVCAERDRGPGKGEHLLGEGRHGKYNRVRKRRLPRWSVGGLEGTLVLDGSQGKRADCENEENRGGSKRRTGKGLAGK